MVYTDLKGRTIFYQTINIPGEARGSLVFMHGAGGSSRNWARTLNLGIEGWNMIALDLPGHGESPGDPLESISDYASVIREFLLQTGFSRPILLVGHSMGASISLQIGLSYPNMVDGLVLVAAGARMPVNKQMLEQLARETFDIGFLKFAYGPEMPPDLMQLELEQMSRVPQRHLFIDFTACDNFDVSAQLGSLALPALILVGEKDKMVPLKNSQFLNQNIEGSMLKLIPGSGHSPMLEKPEETVIAIREFLNQRFA